jgi:hypothetical protein
MPSRRVARSLTYNEEKVTRGKAECILAANYLKSLTRLSYEDKLHVLKKRMALNDRIKTSQHITLNFDPADNLSNEQMQKIAKSYMKEIGFGQQPYLVYRHYDAGHPHCHIVTTHVLRNGDPIELYNIGRNQSETARQRIETEFQLVTAEMKKQQRYQQQQIDGVQKIKYGEQAITRSISRVLEHVTSNFNCASLKEFNTILRLYNLEAYRGKESSQLYQHRGLLYRVLDETGQYIGLPIKASFFDCKPTLDNLEKQFVQHQSQKLQYRQHVATEIQWQLRQHPNSFDTVKEKLAKEKIRVVLQKDKEGICRGITYIDFKNKFLFPGDELGERCNAAAIQKVIDQQKLAATQQVQQTQHQTARQAYRLRQSF